MYSKTRTLREGLTVLIAVVVGGLSVASLWGQAIYGSIYGQVTDSSGAAIANATVTVKDVAKGTSVQATTNSIGEYSVEHLIPDVYDVDGRRNRISRNREQGHSSFGGHVAQGGFEAGCGFGYGNCDGYR